MNNKTKICTRCKLEKSLSEFRRRGKSFNSYCRLCERELSKKYYESNLEKVSTSRKKIRENNPEKIKSICKKYRESNREIINSRGRERRKKYTEKVRAYAREYYQNHKEELRKLNRKYSQINRKKINERQKNRLKTNSTFHLNQTMSVTINQSLKSKNGSKRDRHWEKLVDFTLAELKKYLEKQFTDGMTWDNYGDWHIDHRIPISVFNFTDVGQIDFKKCWSLGNLQPLWAQENMRKSDKLEKPFQSSLAF